MATANEVLCGVCETRHLTRCADHWCPECEEGLCSECQSHHLSSKGTRRHKVISIENYKKLPPSVSTLVQHCNDHDLKYTNFCQHHNALCCPACISSSHKDCLGRMVSVEEIVKAFKDSVSLENIAQCCIDLKQNIDKVTVDRKQNLSNVQEQRKNIQKEIKQMRVKINSHLDELEKRIITELDAAEDKIKSKIETVLTQLSVESNSVEELHNNILAVKEYASDLQTFLGIKTLEAQVETKQKVLQSLLMDGNLQQLNLSCSIDKTVSNVLSVVTFGSVSIDTSPLSVDLKTEREKQAQIVAVIQQPNPKSINDIKLTLHSSISIPPKGKYDNFIKGCTVFPDMKMAFVEFNNKRLVILTVDGKLNKKITCCEPQDGPNDVTSIDDRTVAVTTNFGIKIINIESEKTERTIKTTCRCHGITHHKGTLLWCEVSKGIQMLQLTDQRYTTTLVKQDKLGNFSYITTSDDKIYQTDNYNDTVTCFTTTGDKLWEYKDTLVVKTPNGIAVDSNYNVYITSQRNNSVVVLSSDGKQSRKLIRQEHGLNRPRALHYDVKNNKLLVCNSNGHGFMYDI